MPFSQYQKAKDEIAQYPEDYGICDGERAAEISAGAKFTEQEWQLIDEAILAMKILILLSISSPTTKIRYMG
jgi:hypothetical protein